MLFIFSISVKEKIIFFKIKIVIRLQWESKTFLTSICNSWSIFWEGGTKFFVSDTRHLLSTFHIPCQRSPRGTPRNFFLLYTRVAPPIYVPATSFKLMTLRNIRVEEAFPAKGASLTMKQVVKQPDRFLFNTNFNPK